MNFQGPFSSARTLVDRPHAGGLSLLPSLDSTALPDQHGQTGIAQTVSGFFIR